MIIVITFQDIGHIPNRAFIIVVFLTRTIFPLARVDDVYLALALHITQESVRNSRNRVVPLGNKSKPASESAAEERIYSPVVHSIHDGHTVDEVHKCLIPDARRTIGDGAEADSGRKVER